MNDHLQEFIAGGIETSIGKLEFKGGYPSKETIEKLYDQLDLQRAAQSSRSTKTGGKGEELETRQSSKIK